MKPNKILAFLLVFIFISGSVQSVTRRPLTATHAAVASASNLASQIGVDVMKKGGNAVDAAVAVAFALAVVWPSAGNIGGGGFMIVRLKDGTTEALDFRERAPGAAFKEMYLDKDGNVIPKLSSTGYKAVGVPGTVAGLSFALKKHGKLSWAQLLEPAYQLAKNGFILNEGVPKIIGQNKDRLAKFEDSRKIFLPGGNPVKAGTRFVQPDLAATLKRIQNEGPREFYEGKTARMLVEDMKANGGLITMQDLKEYEPTERQPLRGTYRDHEVITMPPPSSGGIVLLEMLNMAENYQLKETGFQSAQHVHLYTEIMKRAFADRANLMGDPDFVSMPVERLIDKNYARERIASINPMKATPSENIQAGIVAAKEPENTTHFSIIDPEGNIVSCTYTLNDSYGSAVVAKGTGLVLNNEMDDFTSKPGVPNIYGLLQGEANAIKPRKRPLSSMTPTIVLRDGKPFLIIGARGGPTITTTVFHVVTAVIDFDMNIQEALDAPRFHHQWMPDQIYTEPFGINPDTRKLLESYGDKLSDTPFSESTPYIAGAEGILIDPSTGLITAASETRDYGAPAGY